GVRRGDRRGPRARLEGRLVPRADRGALRRALRLAAARRAPGLDPAARRCADRRRRRRGEAGRGRSGAGRGGGCHAGGMRSPIPDYLADVVDRCRSDHSGRLADYIPPLAEVEPDVTALALSTVDGTVYAVGDAGLEFTIQSISKPFVYALALAEHGIDAVLGRVGVEPSGEA